ncbi:NADP-dependent oxidoreductase [Pseudonocardia sp. CA-107938]|uniref:NADP-dependent oxidoreductase n=1 Tax=Pseudonocardia sp. CA-107938 TaxID=3240021 RepID=UPI003D93282E
MRSREFHLAARPTGEPRLSDLQLVTVDVPEPERGQVVVRNTWMSVDPYMRGRMDDVPSYIPPFAIGAPLEGSALGEVIASRAPGVPVGATVVHFAGWREIAVVEAADVTVVDPALAGPEAWLGPLGMTGLTAWVAVTEIAPVRPGDTVFVSAAAGAVGSVAGQLARKAGAAVVIGSAGGPEKAKKLVADLGFDHGLDHRAGPIADQLAAAAPDGIDVYVDNVGGDHLQAALASARLGARFALVGGISGYNGDAVGVTNTYQSVVRRATLRGMLVTEWTHLAPVWVQRAAGWLADGSLRTESTVVDGLEAAPEAFLGLLRGKNTGKMLVRL